MPRRPVPPDQVYFPVVPMLDMAFQLLAFFILTFQPPGRESRIDLDLPAAPVALPPGPSRPVAPGSTTRPSVEGGVEADLTLRAEADAAGRLRALRLDSTALDGPEALADRLRDLVARRADRPLSVALVADETLLYDEAAKLIGACSSAGVAAIRLVPASVPAAARPGEEAP